eukprot:14110054-Alexandrium_andersonii.AAC.1
MARLRSAAPTPLLALLQASQQWQRQGREDQNRSEGCPQLAELPDPGTEVGPFFPHKPHF